MILGDTPESKKSMKKELEEINKNLKNVIKSTTQKQKEEDNNVIYEENIDNAATFLKAAVGMKNLSLPCEPNQPAKIVRDRQSFNYLNLYGAKMLPKEHYNNEWGIIMEHSVNGNPYSYHGQIGDNGLPNGIGIAVTQDGNVQEGLWEEGFLKCPSLKIFKNG